MITNGYYMAYEPKHTSASYLYSLKYNLVSVFLCDICHEVHKHMY